MEQSNRGISFKGLNSDATNYYINTHGTHQYGLFLDNNTVIGDQYEKFNVWSGSTGQIEGKFNFVAYSFTNFFDVAFVNLSKFSINTFNVNSTRWANPRLVGNDNDATCNWFTPTSEVSNGVLCSLSPKGKTESDNRIISGTYSPVRGVVATVWELSTTPMEDF